MVIGDPRKFSEGEGILGVFVRGCHVATSGVDGGDAIQCQDPASTSPWGSTGNVGWGLWHGRSYSRFRRTHTSGVLTRSLWTRCSHTPCVGLLFSRYPLRPAWSLRGSSHTPCVGSLFSHALRGHVVLAVSVTPGVVSSLLFSHALRGLVALGEWWSQCRSRG